MIICHTFREFFCYFNYISMTTSCKVPTYLACIYTISKGIVEPDVYETLFNGLIHTQLANWLEHYAEVLELNVWTSSTTTSVSQDPNTNKWYVTVKRGQEGIERKFIVNHLIFATGLSGLPNTPIYPGMVSFFLSKI
jgi:cation diffusion facilitator CzcD-associated flavoprotein CzcO